MESQSEQPANKTAIAPLSILIVDDEPNIRKVLAINLKSDGHQVTAVGTFSDALSEAARQPFDLAMVDLRLGTEAGLDLLPKLRSESPWIRVVVITAYASVEP